VRLTSTNGSAIELDIVGYEAPHLDQPVAGVEPYDWLLVRGRIVDVNRSWTFRSGCLDTYDARQLYAWLVRVADGSATPSAQSAAGSHIVLFSEPELEVQLLGRDAGQSRMRWTFVGEAAPPWVSAKQGGRDGYPVEIVVRTAEVQVAAETWRRQLDSLPAG
jgi:hypothetical protein